MFSEILKSLGYESINSRDLLDKEGNLKLKFLAVGYSKEEIDVSVVDNYLVINGKPTLNSERLLDLNLKIALHPNLDHDTIDVSLDKGLLYIRIKSKAVKEKPSKKIVIK